MATLTRGVVAKYFHYPRIHKNIFLRKRKEILCSRGKSEEKFIIAVKIYN